MNFINKNSAARSVQLLMTNQLRNLFHSEYMDMKQFDACLARIFSLALAVTLEHIIIVEYDPLNLTHKIAGPLCFHINRDMLSPIKPFYYKGSKLHKK